MKLPRPGPFSVIASVGIDRPHEFPIAPLGPQVRVNRPEAAVGRALLAHSSKFACERASHPRHLILAHTLVCRLRNVHHVDVGNIVELARPGFPHRDDRESHCLVPLGSGAGKCERALKRGISEITKESRNLGLAVHGGFRLHISSRYLSEQKIVGAAKGPTRLGAGSSNGRRGRGVRADGGQHYLAKTLARGPVKRRTLKNLLQLVHLPRESIPERDRAAEYKHQGAPESFVANDTRKLLGLARRLSRIGKASEPEESLVRVCRCPHRPHELWRNTRE